GKYFYSADPSGNNGYFYYDESYDTGTGGRIYGTMQGEGGIARDLGFLWGSGESVISYFSANGFYPGSGAVFSYYDPRTRVVGSRKIEFDNGDIAEERLVNDERRSLKYTAADGKISWFLWGEDVYGGYDNVAIDYLSSPAALGTGRVGSSPVDMAVTGDGKYVYTANFNDDAISVLRISDNALVDTLEICSGPYGMKLTPDGKYLYVANYFDDSVIVVRTSDNSVVKTINVGSLSLDSVPIAMSPDGDHVYVANGYSGSVSVIRTSVNAVLKTITVGGEPAKIAVTPDGAYLYVANRADGTVSVIMTSTNKVVKTVASGGEPVDIAVSPDGAYAYVVNTAGNSLSVIRTSDNSVVGQADTGIGPERVVLTPDGAYAYVSNGEGNTVTVISTSDNSVISTVTVGAGPKNIVITNNGTLAYVTNYSDGTVSVIKIPDNSVIETIASGDGPRVMAVTPDGNNVLVLNEGSDSVLAIDTNIGCRAYTFDPDARDMNMLVASRGFVGTVQNPSSVLNSFADLGDWWEWCFDNSIVPEFPPLAADYVRDEAGRIISRLDHNDHLDTSYAYAWDHGSAGTVKVDISYDHDGDGSFEQVRSGTYLYGDDNDIANIGSWTLLSETRYDRAGEMDKGYEYYPGSGRVKTDIKYKPSGRDDILGELDPGTKYVKRYYLDEAPVSGKARIARIEAPLAQRRLDLSGSGNYVDCGDGPALEIGEGSVSIWVNFSQEALGTWQPIAVKRGSDGNTFEIWKNAADKLFVIAGDGSGYVYFTEPEYGLGASSKWYNVILTFDGTTLEAYIGGRQVFSYGYTGPGMDFAGDLLLGGCGPDGESLSGELKDVRIFSRALDGPDIVQLLSDPASVPGMAAGWALDEGSGDTAKDSAGGNDGVIRGASWVDMGISDKSWSYEYTYLDPLDPSNTALLKREKKDMDTGVIIETCDYYSGGNDRIETVEVLRETAPGEFEGKHVRYRYLDESGAGGSGRLVKAEVIEPVGELVFSGNSDNVDLGNGPDLKLAVFSMTMSVKFAGGTGGQWEPILTKRSADGKSFEIWRDTNGRLYIMGSNAGGFVYARELTSSLGSEDAWYDIAVTYDGAVLRGYVNGIMAINADLPLYGLDFDADIFLGYRSLDGKSLEGSMDDLRIFDRALSAREVIGVMDKDDVTEGLVSRWQMDEGAREILKDTVGGNTGMISGPLWITTGISENDRYYEYVYSDPSDPANTVLEARIGKYSSNDEVSEISSYYDDAANRLKTREVIKESAPGEFYGQHVIYHYKNEDNGTGQGRLERVDVITYDWAMNFRKDGDAVNCGHDPSMNLATLTVSARVSFADDAMSLWQPIIVKRTEDPAKTFELFKTNDNKLYFTGTSGNGDYVYYRVSSPVLAKDTWYNVAVTYDGTDLIIYLDGREVLSETVGIDGMDFDADLFLGYRRSSDTSLRGKIKDVDLYERALSASEIRSLYDGSVISDGQVSDWEFLAGSGPSIEDTLGDNDGVITGAEWSEEGISDDSYYYEYVYLNENDPADGTLLSRTKKNYNTGEIMDQGGAGGMSLKSGRSRKINSERLSEVSSRNEIILKKNEMTGGVNTLAADSPALIQIINTAYSKQ
ncbi:MAG: beta-propeller fold lactonase family protein, partial [Candidatus Omnitrophica bacterium]|nr:beta-propeller fold lactonase family protein [Candidatus Omnitrophota bacterium]